MYFSQILDELVLFFCRTIVFLRLNYITNIFGWEPNFAIIHSGKNRPTTSPNYRIIDCSSALGPIDINISRIFGLSLFTPNLKQILKNQLSTNLIYEAGNYEKIGVPIKVDEALSPLIMAIHRAFCDHRPLVLRPDDLLLPIVQAVGIYFSTLNQDKLRKEYFKRSGKIDLIVKRDDFILGNENNPWNEVFAEFADLIAQELGPELKDTLSGNFTTTGPFQNTAYNVALMKAAGSVFNYSTNTMCGIPIIELQGTPDDWIQLGVKILKISALLNYPEWTELLEKEIVKPITEEAINAKNNNTSMTSSANFWVNIYKYGSSSGGSHIDGWIKYLFPFKYGHSLVQIHELKRPVRNFSQFMPGYTTVPMKWNYYGKIMDMRILAGHVGVCQRSDGFLQAMWGWGVFHNSA